MLKGSITFDSNTIGLRSVNAYIQADRSTIRGKSPAELASGSDAEYCTKTAVNAISTSACQYGHIFGKDASCAAEDSYVNLRMGSASSGTFQVQINENAMPNFKMFYATLESFLEIRISVPYPLEVQTCLRGEARGGAADMDEEALWDSHTDVDMVETYDLLTRIPVTVLAAKQISVNSPSEPPIHYLDLGGVPSPVLLAASPLSIKDVDFPIVKGVFQTRLDEDTLRQMLALPYPSWGYLTWAFSFDYFAGHYAGVLWEKKSVTGIIGHPKSAVEIDESEGLENAASMHNLPQAQVVLAA